MKDYNYECDDGRECPVSEMPLADLHELLADPSLIIPHGEAAVPALLERLRIELLIRERNL